jgi:hypothetical protein
MAIDPFGQGETTEPAEKKRGFIYGSENTGYIDQETGETGRVGGTSLFTNINTQLVAEMKAAAKKMGENPGFFEQVFERYNNQFWKDANRDVLKYYADAGMAERRNVSGRTPPDQSAETNAEAYERLVAYGRWWYSSKVPGLADVWAGSSGDDGSGSGRGRSGSGSGATGPTEEDIRNQFDIAQLATRADDLWRTYLLTDSKDPRAMAKAYVDAVVANPEAKLDYDTFVTQNYIEKDPRFASIMVSKPAHEKADEYIQRYLAMASAVLRPANADEAAIGGAQFGADAAAFEQRLQRSNEFRTSSQFMQSLEGRMRSIKEVLRG